MDTEALDKVPEGWVVLDRALTAPRGYVFVCNRKSRWGGEYRHALVPEKAIDRFKEAKKVVKKVAMFEKLGQGDEGNDEF